MRPHEVNELMIAIQKFKERMSELEELVGGHREAPRISRFV